MDHVLAFGANENQHNDRLTVVLDRMLEAGITLNESKCQFGFSRVEFRSHVIDSDGIHAGAWVQSIQDSPKLVNSKLCAIFSASLINLLDFQTKSLMSTSFSEIMLTT